VKLAIMQPYLFPYLGYFQLAAAVDCFVFYDDVNFIKNGWINRNRLFLSGDVRYFTVPLLGASSSSSIAQVGVQPGEVWRRKILESIAQSYAQAPHVAPVLEMVSAVLEGPQTASIGALAKQSVVAVAEYLGLHTAFVWTSQKYGNASLRGVERVLDICRREAASCYVNLPGGRSLYDAAQFAAAGVELAFIEPRLPQYDCGRRPFHAGLSIIDVLMWNDRAAVAELLAPAHTLVAADTAGAAPHERA
jgi:WbqC-like protein family